MNEAESYARRPRDAFWEGYSTEVGSFRMGGVQFEAWNYWLPDTANKRIGQVAAYFKALVDDPAGPPAGRRRMSHFFQSADVSVGLLQRVTRLLRIGRSLLVGDAEVSPIGWAMFGGAMGVSREYFADAQDVVRHYTQTFADKSCKYGPITLFHAEKGGRDGLERVAEDIGCGRNHAALAALMLTHDVLRHGGPDTSDLYYLFTNDTHAGPYDLDRAAWRRAREGLVPGAEKRPDLSRLPRPLPFADARPRRTRVTVSEQAWDPGDCETFCDLSKRLDWEAFKSDNPEWSQR